MARHPYNRPSPLQSFRPWVLPSIALAGLQVGSTPTVPLYLSCFVSLLLYVPLAAVTRCCFIVFSLAELGFTLIPCVRVTWASWAYHISSCWAGLAGPFGFFSSFSLDSTEHYSLGFILFLHSFTFELFKAHLTLQEGPFYYGYLLCLALLLKRVRGPILGSIFYFQKVLCLFR